MYNGDDLKQYFTPITPEIINYMYKYAYSIHNNYMQLTTPNYSILYPELLKLQFDLYPFTDEELPRIQDYIYNADGKLYTKFNFDFDRYSVDFNIWGTKLLVFTDFVVRNYLLSNTLLGFYGYGIYVPFEKYFFSVSTDINFNNYLQNNSVTSIYKNIPKNIYNIDFLKYRDLYPDLNVFTTIKELADHYFTNGQFEPRQIPIIQKTPDIVDNILKSVCVVATNSTNASGFLYSNKTYSSNNNIYLVTCYHVVQNVKDKNIIYAIVKIPSGSVKAAFRFIGCEMYADLMMAVFDPNIPYNKSHNVDLSEAVTININMTQKVHKGDKVFSLTNLGAIDDYSYLEGYVVDNSYYGPDNIDRLKLGSPRSYLLDMPILKGASGSLVFLGDRNSSNISGIGIINSYLNETYSICIEGFITQGILSNIIGRWDYYSIQFADDLILLNNYIKIGFPKKWFGIDFSYYNDVYSSKKYNVLSNYNIMGGVVVNDFIIGYHRKEHKFLYDVMEINDPNCFKINTPLLNTNMHKRFIDSSNSPIVITAITLFDGIKSVYEKFALGRYDNQHSLEILTYGFTQIANIQNNIKQHVNTFLSVYGDITLEYYFFNGLTWEKDIEIISGNDQSRYNLYTDPMGYVYKQHILEFPIPLLNEIDSYEIKVSQIENNYSNLNNQATIATMAAIAAIADQASRAAIATKANSKDMQMIQREFDDGSSSMPPGCTIS